LAIENLLHRFRSSECTNVQEECAASNFTVTALTAFHQKRCNKIKKIKKTELERCNPYWNTHMRSLQILNSECFYLKSFLKKQFLLSCSAYIVILHHIKTTIPKFCIFRKSITIYQRVAPLQEAPPLQKSVRPPCFITGCRKLKITILGKIPTA
jgi:hypothetical protein